MIQLEEALVKVRGDGLWYSVRQFVQPDNPLIQELATVLGEAENPLRACWELVNRIVTYSIEGEQSEDIWKYPVETLIGGLGDCDDSAIALTSLLRNFLPPEKAFVVIGRYEGGGHAYCQCDGIILESTKKPNGVLVSKAQDYQGILYFNDQYIYMKEGDYPGDILPIRIKRR